MSEKTQQPNEQEMLTKLASEGKLPETRFDEFWKQTAPKIEQLLRVKLEIVDEKQLGHLIALSKSVSRMTWTALLGTISTDLDAMMQIEIMISKAAIDAAKTRASGPQ